MMHLMHLPNATGTAMGGWRHPDAWPTDTVMNLQQFIAIAQTAERGKLDAIFFADGNGVRQLDQPELFKALTPSDRPAVFEPVTLLTAISQHTRNIGLISTATTTFEEPYTLARKFGSLDHISGGRSGWNIVTTSTPTDAQNFGFEELMARETRMPRALEFVEVVKGLWDSWADDAFVQDRETGQYLEPSGVHVLDHAGEFFKIKGPLNMARPPQGCPVLFTAGQSDAGRELAAKYADCQFAAVLTKEDAIAFTTDVKARLPKYGRTPDMLKIIPPVGVFVGRTDEEAEEFYQQVGSYIHPSVGVNYLSKTLMRDLSGYDLDGPVPDIDLSADVVGMNSVRLEIAKLIKEKKYSIRQAYERLAPAAGSHLFKGSPQRIADEMEDWYRSGACDGFMLSTAISPRSLEDFVDLVVPELQRRGLFRTEYTGRTLRENMGLPTPPNQFFS